MIFQIFVVYLFVYESYLKQTPLNITFSVSVLVHCVATFIEFHLLNVVCLDAMRMYEIGGAQSLTSGSVLPKQYQRIVSSIEKITWWRELSHSSTFSQNYMFSLRVRGHPLFITAHGLFCLDKILSFAVRFWTSLTRSDIIASVILNVSPICPHFPGSDNNCQLFAHSHSVSIGQNTAAHPQQCRNYTQFLLKHFLYNFRNTHSGMVIRLNEISYSRNKPNKIDSSARKISIAAADK